MRVNIGLTILIFGALQLSGALIASAQTIQNVAGGGGFYVNSPAIDVSLESPGAVAYAPDGTVYLIDGNQVEHLNPSTGLITTVAGTGSSGYSGDGGPATAAELDEPVGIAVDGSGNLFIVDAGNSVIRKVSAATKIISTVAGNGMSGYSGDGGPAIDAEFAYPAGVAVDGSGNLYIADAGNSVIRMVSAINGIISTVVGNGTYGYSGDGGPAIAAELGQPAGVALDGVGNLYIVDRSNSVIRLVSAINGIISTVAGNGTYGYAGDGGPAIAAELGQPLAVAVDGAGNLYIADNGNDVIRMVTAQTGTINTIAGNGAYGYSGDGGPAISAEFNNLDGVAVDASGNLYIADQNNRRIRKDTAKTGIINTVAGNGSYSYSGDGGPATSAQLLFPYGVAADGAGNLYIADTGNSVIRKVSVTTGLISTVAGNATPGYSGDGGPATSAELTLPYGVAVDGAGNLYIADLNNSVIRKVSAATGIISTVAGNGIPGYLGDGGPATGAELADPFGVAVDRAGNLYIADVGNSVIRKVSAATGIISTVAGNGTPGYAGDGAPATSAELSQPFGIAVDGAGNLYIADVGNSDIRKVTAATGIISTVAGNGTPGYSGDGGPATSAELYSPTGVAVDGAGNLYIADVANQRIRMVGAATGIINTAAGDGLYGYSGNGGPATSAELAGPYGVAVSLGGNLYIADTANFVVREVAGLAVPVKAQTIAFGAIASQTVATTVALQGMASSGLPVTFSSSTTSVCTVSGTTASLLTAGTCTITASQPGNIGYAAATPVSQSFSVKLIGDTVTLGIASGTQAYSVRNEFAIGPSYKGSPVPTGTVTLYDNNVALVTLTLGSNGVANYNANPLNAGVNVMTASYSGDSHYAAGVSAPVTLDVTPAPVHLSGSCWGGTPYKVAYQCVITVSASTATPPTGSLTYRLDAGSASSVALNNGTASFTVATLPAPGAHTLTIAYAAQGNYAAATSLTEAFTTAPGQTQLLISASSYYLAAGSPLTLTVTASTPLSGVPTGSVTLYDNGSSLAAVSIGSNGVATYTVPRVPKGSNTYTARYTATADYAAATSGSAAVTAH